ncbi:hypothetical protein DIZ81_06740 [Legionella taurinensis]|uniref:Uncharacterized protein n=2 Tax=Legionella TaxID=445 RepID=A0A0W0XWL9_9GAMM|nr:MULTISPECIES: hypothetical protein [Legionella]KTD49084.1 hypothetical protein Lrub_1435 [Legionella rubrilucens]MDX1837232.1 hypothetical protein [Legionella taurinensis]PUT40295.1 hypothetical protein DB744_06740 [Legionella taurinensis]PUT41529.1 hypothetical protein DB746_09250 [Legionella taurinensis]PUT44395.1 hypothetical protein DB743_08465 [Legionella taurinensis]
MLFKKSAEVAPQDQGCFYIPWVERPRNLEKMKESGHLWTYLTAKNIYRHFYTAPECVPRDNHHVAICFKVRLTSEQQSRLELLKTGVTRVYRGDLSFEPDAIESCLVLTSQESKEYRRESAEENHPSPMTL